MLTKKFEANQRPKTGIIERDARQLQPTASPFDGAKDHRASRA